MNNEIKLEGKKIKGVTCFMFNHKRELHYTLIINKHMSCHII